MVAIHSAVSKNSRIWNAILDKYHYLGRGQLCGAQIRYLIWSERYGYLGGLSFSASAWRLRSRDEHIGWSEEARGRNLQLVANNSRFLIAPMVKVRDLASYVLSESCKRIGGDWQERYGYMPVLVETFIDKERNRGTSYRAANWQYIGDSSGRGRQGKGSGIKEVYLYIR